MKVKSENEVAQSCPTLSDPVDCSLPGSSIHGIFQARVLEWGAIASPKVVDITLIKKLRALGHREKGRVSLEWKDWFSSGSFHGKMGNTAQSIWKIWGE